MNIGQSDTPEEVSVQTVLGPISSEELGMTLAHEHLWASFTNYLWEPPQEWKKSLVNRPVSADIAWALREDPFFHPDNCSLDSVVDAVAELGLFEAAGGRSIVEVSNPGMGRNAEKLVEIAAQSGVNVVMGAGWYIGPTHSEAVRSATVDDLAAQLIGEFTDGVGPSHVKPGVIGEIGVSTTISDSERKTLEASALAFRATGVPVLIHMDGWARIGHEILDILEGAGLPPSAVVLGHMNPSGIDLDYQMSLAERGAWLGFDMTGMGFYYADHGGQAPSADEDAAHVAALMNAGFSERLLISHDVFVKAMLTKNGGNGYVYVPLLFIPRLTRRHGIDPNAAARLLSDNPKQLFVQARKEGDKVQ